MGWMFWLFLVFVGILGIIFIVVLTYLLWAITLVERFVRRCQKLMSTTQFMAPCEIAVAHAVAHGLTFGSLKEDSDSIAQAFPFLEREGRVIGREHVPDESCQCTRQYCLRFGGKRRRSVFRRPDLAWVPDLKPRPA